jgi:hypothetical protein
MAYPQDPRSAPSDPGGPNGRGAGGAVDQRVVKSQHYQTIQGRTYLVTTYDDGTTSNAPADLAGAPGGGEGPAWANAGAHARSVENQDAQHRASLAEQQRQYDLTMGADKSKFDQKMALDQATQKWREAVDARDFESANFWKSRSQELAQNHLALGYTDMMSKLTGPRDWVKYGKLSRGQSLAPGEESVPLDQSMPSWARGVNPGSYGYGSETQPTRGFGGGSDSAAPAGGGAGGVTRTFPSYSPPASTPSAGSAAPAWASVASGGTSISGTDPRLGPVAGQFNAKPITGPATATQGPTNEQLGAQDALVAEGRKPKWFSNGVAIF